MDLRVARAVQPAAGASSEGDPAQLAAALKEARAVIKQLDEVDALCLRGPHTRRALTGAQELLAQQMQASMEIVKARGAAQQRAGTVDKVTHDTCLPRVRACSGCVSHRTGSSSSWTGFKRNTSSCRSSTDAAWLKRVRRAGGEALFGR
jgi:hypothetical protein